MFSYILFTGALFKNFYCRQFFAFEKLQKRSASSGDVRYFVKNIVLLDCGYGVATARQSESLGFSNRHRDLFGTFAELVELEYADRAIPHHSAGLHDDVDYHLCRLGTNIKNHFIIGYVMPVSYTHLRAHETRHDLV